jgi:PEP-CTERM motif
MMKRTSILCFLSLLVMTVSAWSQDNTTVNWTNFSFDSTTQNAILFRNAAGTPLSAGPTSGNNDGMLIQLGYYSTATAGNNFAGVWVPLTGFGMTFHTSIGDSGSGSGSGDGVGDFISLFNLNTTNVVVYPGSPASYTTQASQTITTSVPTNNQILSIRFYDTTTGTSGNYNAVSDNNWKWQTPTTNGGGAVVNLFIADEFGLGNLIFQDNLNPFKTTISAIPEPSTYALMCMGALGMMVLRRRVKK